VRRGPAGFGRGILNNHKLRDQPDTQHGQAGDEQTSSDTPRQLALPEWSQRQPYPCPERSSQLLDPCSKQKCITFDQIQRWENTFGSRGGGQNYGIIGGHRDIDQHAVQHLYKCLDAVMALCGIFGKPFEYRSFHSNRDSAIMDAQRYWFFRSMLELPGRIGGGGKRWRPR